jgi:hypothetical protein
MQKNIKIGGSFDIEHKMLKYQSKLYDAYRAGNVKKLIFYTNKLKLYKTLKNNVNQQGGFITIRDVQTKIINYINNANLTTLDDCNKLQTHVQAYLKNGFTRIHMDLPPPAYKSFEEDYKKLTQEVENILNDRINDLKKKGKDTLLAVDDIKTFPVDIINIIGNYSHHI